MKDLIVLWAFDRICKEEFILKNGIYRIGPITRIVDPFCTISAWLINENTLGEKHPVWGYRRLDFSDAINENYFTKRVSTYTKFTKADMTRVALTVKGFKYLRKRIREIVKNEKTAVVEALAANAEVVCIQKLIEMSGKVGEILISDAEIKLKRPK